MTCKDCIYSPICKVYSGFGVTDIPYDEGDTCEIFKNKTNFVEVVRCKDCKKYTDFDVTNCKRLEFHFCEEFRSITSETDFCSYGERKEGAEQ